MLKGVDLTSVLGNTLHGDGTTKYHRHYQNFQINTVDNIPLSVGLLEIVDQDAETILASWKDKISDIAKAVCGNTATENDVEKTVNELLCTVKNTMSDHCATNGVFNSLLEEMRKNLLPNVISNWKGLDEEGKRKLEEMGNFFCKVHPLITFAEECNKSLLKFETASLKGKSKFAYPQGGESGAVRLIRTACSAFQRRGHQAAGMSADFEVYLTELALPMKLIQMEGNRFNVIFYNAGAAYFHRNHFINFINAKSMQNRLLLAVLEDASNVVYLAGVRALGIISKLVTGPYFKIVGEMKSVLEMNPHLHQLQISMERCSKDAQSLLEGENIFDENLAPITKDQIFEELFKVPEDEEFQILTQQALELLCTSILLVLERQCHEQLPGGQYFNPSDDLKAQAKNVLPSNIIAERDFARFDNLLKAKPNSTVTSLEATIMWCANKPAKWLDSLSEKERAEKQKEARDSVKGIKQKMKERRQQILATRKRRMEEESHQKKLESQRKLSEKKFKFMVKLEKLGGLWKSVEEMKIFLRNIEEEKMKIEAIYTQLQFHNIVLTSCAPKQFYFQKSHTEKGRKIDFTSNQM